MVREHQGPAVRVGDRDRRARDAIDQLSARRAEGAVGKVEQ
jgi:hypothetical protein